MDREVRKGKIKFDPRKEISCLAASQNYLFFGSLKGNIRIYCRETFDPILLIPSTDLQKSTSKNDLSGKPPSIKLIECHFEEHEFSAINDLNEILVFRIRNIGNSVKTITCKVIHRVRIEGPKITSQCFALIRTPKIFLFVGDEEGKVIEIDFSRNAILKGTKNTISKSKDSRIVQMSFSKNRLLVSSLHWTRILDVSKRTIQRIGKTERNGEFGACFYTNEESVESIFCCRPGGKLWKVDGNSCKVKATYKYPKVRKNVMDFMCIYPLGNAVVTFNEEFVMLLNLKKAKYLQVRNDLIRVKEIKRYGNVCYFLHVTKKDETLLSFWKSYGNAEMNFIENEMLIRSRMRSSSVVSTGSSRSTRSSRSNISRRSRKRKKKELSEKKRREKEALKEEVRNSERGDIGSPENLIQSPMLFENMNFDDDDNIVKKRVIKKKEKTEGVNLKEMVQPHLEKFDKKESVMENKIETEKSSENSMTEEDKDIIRNILSDKGEEKEVSKSKEPVGNEKMVKVESKVMDNTRKDDVLKKEDGDSETKLQSPLENQSRIANNEKDAMGVVEKEKKGTIIEPKKKEPFVQNPVVEKKEAKRVEKKRVIDKSITMINRTPTSPMNEYELIKLRSMMELKGDWNSPILDKSSTKKSHSVNGNPIKKKKKKKVKRRTIVEFEDDGIVNNIKITPVRKSPKRGKKKTSLTSPVAAKSMEKKVLFPTINEEKVVNKAEPVEKKRNLEEESRKKGSEIKVFKEMIDIIPGLYDRITNKKYKYLKSEVPEFNQELNDFVMKRLSSIVDKPNFKIQFAYVPIKTKKMFSFVLEKWTFLKLNDRKDGKIVNEEEVGNVFYKILPYFVPNFMGIFLKLYVRKEDSFCKLILKYEEKNDLLLKERNLLYSLVKGKEYISCLEQLKLIVFRKKVKSETESKSPMVTLIYRFVPYFLKEFNIHTSYTEKFNQFFEEKLMNFCIEMYPKYMLPWFVENYLILERSKSFEFYMRYLIKLYETKNEAIKDINFLKTFVKNLIKCIKGNAVKRKVKMKDESIKENRIQNLSKNGSGVNSSEEELNKGKLFSILKNLIELCALKKSVLTFKQLENILLTEENCLEELLYLYQHFGKNEAILEMLVKSENVMGLMQYMESNPSLPNWKFLLNCVKKYNSKVVHIELIFGMMCVCMGSKFVLDFLNKYSDQYELPSTFYNKMCNLAKMENDQGILKHEILEIMDSYLWTRKMKSVPPQIVVLSEIITKHSNYNKNVYLNNLTETFPILDDSDKKLNFLIDFSKIQQTNQTCHRHWGIQIDISTLKCGVCNLDILENVGSEICIFKCGHAYHTFCNYTMSCLKCQNNSFKGLL